MFTSSSLSCWLRKKSIHFCLANSEFTLEDYKFLNIKKIPLIILHLLTHSKTAFNIFLPFPDPFKIIDNTTRIVSILFLNKHQLHTLFHTFSYMYMKNFPTGVHSPKNDLHQIMPVFLLFCRWRPLGPFINRQVMCKQVLNQRCRKTCSEEILVVMEFIEFYQYFPFDGLTVAWVWA